MPKEEKGRVHTVGGTAIHESCHCHNTLRYHVGYGTSDCCFSADYLVSKEGSNKLNAAQAKQERDCLSNFVRQG